MDALMDNSFIHQRFILTYCALNTIIEFEIQHWVGVYILVWGDDHLVIKRISAY